MKKFSALIYCFIMAALVLPLSGCGGGGGSDDGGTATSASDKLMVITSPVLQKNGSYRIYRGDRVRVRSTTADYNPTYYVAPVSGTDNVTMNLEFADSISQDKPMIITQENSNGTEDIVFYYNPNGNGQTDTTTAYGDVYMWGGSTQQLSYSGLNLSGASASSAFLASIIDGLDSANEIVLTLDGDTATADGSSVPVYNYVWHADPDHRDEYYTLELNGSTELTESAMMENVTPVKGVYINHDIRYIPNTITFSGTAKNDDETEYAAYYSDSVAEELKAELGDNYAGPYIFATLPQSAGMGGMGGNPGQDRGTPPNMRGAVSNSDISAFSTMTHSPEDAYNNPVLHITESGLYRLKGTWHGQIWIDAGSDAQAVIILDNVTVSCDVAPALVFHDVHECGPDDEDTVASEWKTLGAEVAEDAGAVVVIASGSTNNFTGANVYRMLKAQKKKDSVTTIDGTDVSQQKKRYKMDGAFYSFVSMVIGAESDTNPGTLNITSTTYEGLDTEMHLTIDSGKVNVTAEDDGINVNEDDISVFTLNGGTLTVIAKGGDGIDSNGYIVLNNGTLDITAAQDSNQDNAQAEGPMDADKEIYRSDSVTYTHRAYSGGTSTQPDSGNTDSGNTDSGNTDSGNTDSGNTDSGNNQSLTDNPVSYTTTKTPISITNSSGQVVMSVTYTTPELDTETSDRGIETSGDVFTLTHTVNNFSGVK
ncbi:MAG: carbohydrate-binding domain-containing protein [Synergistaceae bacterium]|nr:carbohydrate-binding domain-containing protein [Synergistaceae bacterium]